MLSESRVRHSFDCTAVYSAQTAKRCLLSGTNLKLIYLLTLTWWLSPRRTGFHSRPIHAIFVVKTEALGQAFLPELLFSSVIIISPVLHINLHLHVALTRWEKGEAWEPSKKQCFARDRGALDRKLLLHEDQREVTSTNVNVRKKDRNT